MKTPPTQRTTTHKWFYLIVDQQGTCVSDEYKVAEAGSSEAVRTRAKADADAKAKERQEKAQKTAQPAQTPTTIVSNP